MIGIDALPLSALEQHEAVAGEPLMRDAFRSRLSRSGGHGAMSDGTWGEGCACYCA